MFDTLFLWHLADPRNPRLVGTLRRALDGKGVSLRYDAGWLRQGFALSEDLPMRDVEYLPRGRLSDGGARAVGAVDDARPDRWGERVIDFIDRPKRRSLMEYLFYAGDDRHGALGVSISKDDYQPRRGGPLPKLQDVNTVSEAIQKIINREPLNEIERRILSAGGSFGGAKPKALMVIDGAEWLVKFSNGEPVDTPLIEHATMTLARQAGINTAETLVLKLQGEHAVAIRRFDRQGTSRLHTISAGTALRASTTPGQLSLGYPDLARLLRRSGLALANQSVRDAEELFRRMVFNILIDNTDDHEKNHSLIDHGDRSQGRYILSPAYDVLPTASGQGQQEFICGDSGRESSLTNALSDCGAFGLTRDAAIQQIVDIIRVLNTWREHFSVCGVTSHDIEFVAHTVEHSEIGAERRAFSSGAPRRPSSSTKSPRSGAFRPK
jgi:serine/threonine-protein kinase HipA